MKEGVLATGRRKTSVAKVWLLPGNGKILVNDRPIDEYFLVLKPLVQVRQPLKETNTLDKFDVIAEVKGGGLYRSSGCYPSWNCKSAFRHRR